MEYARDLGQVELWEESLSRSLERRNKPRRVIGRAAPVETGARSDARGRDRALGPLLAAAPSGGRSARRCRGRASRSAGVVRRWRWRQPRRVPSSVGRPCSAARKQSAALEADADGFQSLRGASPIARGRAPPCGSVRRGAWPSTRRAPAPHVATRPASHATQAEQRRPAATRHTRQRSSRHGRVGPPPLTRPSTTSRPWAPAAERASQRPTGHTRAPARQIDRRASADDSQADGRHPPSGGVGQGHQADDPDRGAARRPGSYANPFAHTSVTPERIDQGVDYSGSGTLPRSAPARSSTRPPRAPAGRGRSSSTA